MTETENKPFLIISGSIRLNKAKEFEQTFRLALGSLSDRCIKYSLSADAIKSQRYHFFSIWSDQASLNAFLNSTEYQLMNGAFHTLGNVDHVFNGLINENISA